MLCLSTKATNNRAEPWIQNYHLGELCPQDIKDAKVPPAPPDAIEAREFFRRRIKRTGAREKTLFSNETSNYQLGGQFGAVSASSSIGRAKKDWAATCPQNGLPKHCCRGVQRYGALVDVAMG